MSRVVLAAVQAALADEKPMKKQGLSTGQALALGAALVVVGRVAVGPGARFVRDKLQGRLSEGPESEDAGDEDLEEPEAELQEDHEPEARPRASRPRPSPVRPSRRSRPKGDADKEPKLAAPRRPRRPRAPTGRT